SSWWKSTSAVWHPTWSGGQLAIHGTPPSGGVPPSCARAPLGSRASASAIVRCFVPIPIGRKSSRARESEQRRNSLTARAARRDRERARPPLRRAMRGARVAGQRDAKAAANEGSSRRDDRPCALCSIV